MVVVWDERGYGGDGVLRMLALGAAKLASAEMRGTSDGARSQVSGRDQVSRLELSTYWQLEK